MPFPGHGKHVEGNYRAVEHHNTEYQEDIGTAYLYVQRIHIYIRVQFLEICVRRYHSFFQDQNSFDNACKSTSSLKMTNVGLDRTAFDLLAEILVNETVPEELTHIEAHLCSCIF